jgi:hypothetical protein
MTVSSNSIAAGDRLIEAVMRSDFIFDREISDVPFFPLGYISHTSQSSLELEGCASINCEFDYQEFSQGFAAPVWVGKKNMFILGETYENNRVDTENSSINIKSAGLIAAWVAQPNEHWQTGGFVYAYKGIGGDPLAREPNGSVSGVVARYRHKPQFHSYWGLVRFAENGETTLFPYLGFDWYLGKQWNISGVIPWPTVNYAPNKDSLVKVGALFSGSEWAINSEDKVFTNEFSKVDFGIAYERKLWKMIWGELAVGYSGFGKAIIQSDADIEFESDINSAPFVRLSLNYRID